MLLSRRSGLIVPDHLAPHPAWNAKRVLVPQHGLDLVTGAKPSGNSATFPLVSPMGVGCRTSANTNEMHWGTPSAADGIDISGPRVFLWGGVLTSVSGSAYAVFSRYYHGSVNYTKSKWRLGTNGASLVARASFGKADNTWLDLVGTSTLSYWKPLVMASYYTDQVVQLWVDGVLEAEAASPGYMALADVAGRLALGRESYSYSAANAFHQVGAVLDARDMGPDDVCQLSADYTRLFQAPRRRRVFAVGAGGGALTGAPCTQDNTSAAGAATQTHQLIGAASAQAAASSAGALAQTHLLAGAASEQANATSTGAESQTHVLAGAPCSQAAVSDAGAVGQAHQLQGAASTQSATDAGGAVAQAHVLAGAASSQANTCTSGALDGGVTLAGSTCSQANTCTGGAVGQTHAIASGTDVQAAASAVGALTQAHVLAGAASNQAATSSTGALPSGHTLAGSTCSQANACTGGAVGQAHALIAAPSVQDAVAAASAIVQQHLLAGAGCEQASESSADAIGIDVIALAAPRSASANLQQSGRRANAQRDGRPSNLQ